MKLTDVEAIALALDAGGVRYLVAGGLAVAAHGYGRLTFDLDLVVQLTPRNAKAALDALAGIGYRPRVPVTADQFADAATRQGWIREKHMTVLNLWSERHRETPVDVFVTEPFDFDAEWERALAQELLPGLVVRFVGLDALILMKEAAGRPKDADDLEHLRRLREDRRS